MGLHHLTLLESHPCTITTNDASGDDALWYKIGMVTKCGWIFVAELRVSSSSATSTTNTSNSTANQSNTQTNSNSVQLRLRIVHRTHRIQCYSSTNEPLPNLGGMALQFSLPDIPIPSSNHGLENGLVWLGDVKTRRYTMPPKDKYVLSEEHGTTSSLQEVVLGIIPDVGASASLKANLRQPGEGLMLAHLGTSFLGASSAAVGTRAGTQGGDNEKHADEEVTNNGDYHICARLPLSQHGSPLSLATHPNGEWMVIGYGMNSRGAATKPLELVCLRKRICQSR